MLRQSQDIWGWIYMTNLKENKKSYIPFITAGDPSLDDTKRFIEILINSKASLIEIGIPFSDPIAEGRNIEEADKRALKANTTADKIFDMLRDVRQDYPDFPLALMTYLNPVFTYGYDRFFSKCHDVNICAIIIPDCPYEEKNEVRSIAINYGVKVISMIAPSSNKRIDMISKDAEGFIYLSPNANSDSFISGIRKNTMIPIYMDIYPISHKQIEKADGVIISSSIVDIIAQYGKDSEQFIVDFSKKIIDILWFIVIDKEKVFIFSFLLG